MPIKIVGEPIKITRFKTGLYLFDRAFMNAKGDVGLPLGTIISIAGHPGVGKSTSVYSLSGMIAKEIGMDISLADFEGFDSDYLLDILEFNGFDGNLSLIQKDKDVDALSELLVQIKSDQYGIGIIDSVGAIAPTSEQEGELEEANMGRRAFLMGQFCRSAINHLRKTSKNVFAINHLNPDFGGFGFNMPGGQQLKFLSGITIRISKGKIFEDDGSFIVKGAVKKNKFGVGKRTFELFILSGKGIHKGLTAMWDCLRLEKVEYSRTIKIDGKSVGYVKDFIQSAHDKDDEAFQPFIDLLND